MAAARNLTLVLGLAGAFALRAACRHHHEPIRIATFNIEDFPQRASQVTGAFAEIRGLDAGIVAVQEIIDPELFAREAADRLGDRWQFVTTAPTAGPHELGVLFDRGAWTLLSTRIHDTTRLGDHHKPTFEVRLRAVDGGEIARVLVVHFKSGSEGRDVRARQYAALQPIVREAASSGERVVVLGDFNATELADRVDLAALARATGTVWASEPLACTAFWRRADGCPRSRLDHVLTTERPTSVVAAGACATEGCDRQDRCPLYAREISDHCPVVIELP